MRRLMAIAVLLAGFPLRCAAGDPRAMPSTGDGGSHQSTGDGEDDDGSATGAAGFLERVARGATQGSARAAPKARLRDSPGSETPSGAQGAGAQDGTTRQEAAQQAGVAAAPAVGQGAIGQKGQKAMARAKNAAENLKRQFSVGDLEGADSNSGAAGAGAAASKGADPALPRTKDDLALASVVGFGGAFSALGLRAARTGAGAEILRKDGSPASAQELASLRARIAVEPKALMARPDFFSVVSHGQFQDLKTLYRGRPDLSETAFRHIGLTQGDRDFERSASCDALSGSCNAYASQLSYKKGDYVPPEDLRAIWKRDGPGQDASAEGESGQEPAAQDAAGETGKALFDKPILKGIYASLNGMVSGLKSFFESGNATPRPGSGANAVGAGPGARGTEYSGEYSHGSKPVTISPPPAAPAIQKERAGYGALAAILGALALAVWSQRRRRG